MGSYHLCNCFSCFSLGIIYENSILEYCWRSHCSFKKHFDYNQEDLAYFIQQLRLLHADVICLQETHSSDQRSVACEIAEQLGGYHVFESAMNPSHINPAFKLGTAILTKESFENAVCNEYPDPPFDLYFSNGKSAIRHPKGVQQLIYKGLNIANTALVPLVIFGYDYHAGEGKKLAGEIEQLLLRELQSPFVLCGDSGMSNEQATAFPKLFETFRIHNALPAVPTYHTTSEVGGLNVPDVMYLSGGSVKQIDSGVVVTDTDHYLCWTEVTVIDE
jgi:hypothetical protein